MASNTIKMVVKLHGTVASIAAIMNHPMETGFRKDPKTATIVPAHFIEEVVCTLNGTTILTALWSGAVSKHPYLSFHVQDAKAGDVVALQWRDNTGDTDAIETKIVG